MPSISFAQESALRNDDGPTIDEVFGKYVLSKGPDSFEAYGPQPSPPSLPHHRSQQFVTTQLPTHVLHRFAPVIVQDSNSALTMPDTLPYDGAPPTPAVGPGSPDGHVPTYYLPAGGPPSTFQFEALSDSEEEEEVDWQAHRVVQAGPGRAGKRAGFRGGARPRKLSNPHRAALLSEFMQSADRSQVDAFRSLTPSSKDPSSRVREMRANPREPDVCFSGSSVFPWDAPSGPVLPEPLIEVPENVAETQAMPQSIPPLPNHLGGVASDVGRVIAYDPKLAARIGKFGWI